MTPFDAAVFIVKVIGWLVLFYVALWLFGVLFGAGIEACWDSKPDKANKPAEWDGSSVISNKTALTIGLFVVGMAIVLYFCSPLV